MMRKKHPSGFKFKVALEALSGKPVIDICKNYALSQSVVHRWKDHLKNAGGKIFGEMKSSSPEMEWERERNKLYQQIGEMSTELNFLKKIVGEK